MFGESKFMVMFITFVFYFLSLLLVPSFFFVLRVFIFTRALSVKYHLMVMMICSSTLTADDICSVPFHVNELIACCVIKLNENQNI